MVLSFLRMFRKRKKDYQIKDVVIPDDGNAISHRFSELSCKSSGNGIPCHSSWQCWIRCHVGCCFDTWLPAILSLRTTGCMCQFDALGCPYTQSRMLTYTKDQTFDLKIPWFFWATTRPGFVAEILWTFQEFFQPWPFWTKLWVDSGRLFISVVVYTLKVCLALTPLLGMAWTHSLKPDEDEPQSESREDIKKLSMLESRFCSNQSVIPWREFSDLSKPGMSQFRRKSVARMFSGHPSGSGVQSPRVNCSLKVYKMCLKFSHGCFVQSFVGFQNSWNIRIWRYFRSSVLDVPRLICLQIVL